MAVRRIALLSSGQKLHLRVWQARARRQGRVPALEWVDFDLCLGLLLLLEQIHVDCNGRCLVLVGRIGELRS